MCYRGTLVRMESNSLLVERVQTGVRIEKRLVKVLKAFAEYHDLTLGDLLEGIGRFSDAPRRFAAAQGKPNLYHETITWAYVLIIRQRMAQSANQEWDEFAQNNPDLFVSKKGILSRYYSEEVLNSDLARKVFIFPDK